MTAHELDERVAFARRISVYDLQRGSHIHSLPVEARIAPLTMQLIITNGINIRHDGCCRCWHCQSTRANLERAG